MAPIIAFLISLGVIFSADQATSGLIEEYQEQYEAQENNVVITDLSGL
jgi:hypothetical protein